MSNIEIHDRAAAMREESARLLAEAKTLEVE